MQDHHLHISCSRQLLHAPSAARRVRPPGSAGLRISHCHSPLMFLIFFLSLGYDPLYKLIFGSVLSLNFRELEENCDSLTQIRQTGSTCQNGRCVGLMPTIFDVRGSFVSDSNQFSVSSIPQRSKLAVSSAAAHDDAGREERGGDDHWMCGCVKADGRCREGARRGGSSVCGGAKPHPCPF